MLDLMLYRRDLDYRFEAQTFTVRGNPERKLTTHVYLPDFEKYSATCPLTNADLAGIAGWLTNRTAEDVAAEGITVYGPRPLNDDGRMLMEEVRLREVTSTNLRDTRGPREL